MDLNLLIKTVLDNLHQGAYILDTERRITYWNEGAKKISGYTSEEVVGKYCRDNILVHINEKCQNMCEDFCFVKATLKSGEINEGEAFLHHKEGHRVPVSIRVMPLIDSNETIKGAIEFFMERNTKAMSKEVINELIRYSFLDKVTDLPNRRYIEMKLNSIIEEANKNKIPFGIIVFEVVHLKELNQKYGDATVDKLLKMLSKTISINIGSNAVVGRWSSNRFMIILSDIKKSIFLLKINKLKMLVNNSFFNTPQGEINLETICVDLIIEGFTTYDLIIEKLEQAFTKIKTKLN